MDRRNKVWLILLALLLVAAVAAVIVVNGRLSESRQTIEAMNVELAGAQERSDALSADYESVSAELTAAQENSAALEAQLAEAQEGASGLEAELTEAQSAKEELETQLTEAQSAQAALETQLAAAQAAQAALETELESEQERVVALEARLTEGEAAEEQPENGNMTAWYSVFAADQAPDAIRARSAALESHAAEAQGYLDGLNGLLVAVENGISELTGEPAAERAADVQTPVAEAEDAAATLASLTIVPEVYRNDALKAAEELDMDAIRADVEAILAADESEHTVEEKVEALQAIHTAISGHVAGLNDTLADIACQQAVFAAMNGAESVDDALAAAQENVDQLNAAIAEGEAAIAESEAAIAALEAQVTELSGQSEANSAEIEALNAQIAEEQARAAELSEQLSAALAERDKYIAALEAYRIAHNPSEGEAHAASTLGNRIQVTNGTSASWHYVNNTVSGNSVVLRIEVDGEELYRSAPIAPGGTVESFTLVRALEAGEYEAEAVTSVCDADGSVVSSTRVPVTITVE